MEIFFFFKNPGFFFDKIKKKNYNKKNTKVIINQTLLSVSKKNNLFFIKIILILYRIFYKLPFLFNFKIYKILLLCYSFNNGINLFFITLLIFLTFLI